MTNLPFRNAEPNSPSTHLASLGKAVKIEGKIYSGEDLHVDGEVEGTVELPDHKLTVGSNGSIRAEVKAREIIILGSVQGNVHARDKFEIHKAAKFIGEVKTGRIIIEDGAYFKGSIDIVRTDSVNTPDKHQTTTVEPPGLPVLSNLQPALPH